MTAPSRDPQAGEVEAQNPQTRADPAVPKREPKRDVPPPPRKRVFAFALIGAACLPSGFVASTRKRRPEYSVAPSEFGKSGSVGAVTSWKSGWRSPPM